MWSIQSKHRKSFSIATPGSSVAQTGASLVAPFGAPADVLRAIVPQLSLFSQRNGGPAVVLDRLEKREDRPSGLPQGRAALLTWGVTETPRGGPPHHYLALAHVELAPFSPTGFMVTIHSARAPDRIFAERLPVMLQMMRSLKLDEARIAEKAREGVAAQQRWFAGQQAAHRAQVQAFEAQQEAHRERMRAFDEHNRSWERGQLERARSNDDFDEVIRGVRTVEDTRTGEHRSVSLGDVDRYVEDLNAADPGRYRQIPLRDEADPLPER